MAFIVAQQARAIGLRMALGASQSNVLRSILSEALCRVAVGAALGLVGARVVARLLTSLVFGVQTTSPGVRGGRARTGGDGYARRVRARPTCGPARPARGASSGIARGHYIRSRGITRDGEGILAFAEHSAARIRPLAASVDRYNQRLQQLFCPEDVAFDGNRFNRTAAIAPFFKYLAPNENTEESLVTHIFISWNPLISWLRDIEALQGAA